MANSDVVTVMRTEPALWIERVIVYDDISKKSVLREVAFRRGLNIIYGVSETSELTDAPDDGFLIGHSVGKTSLCRLIRYGLGEDTFGQEDAITQVQGHFPRGAVALQLRLQGAPWSVIRMFQGGVARSYASSTQTIEDLAEQKKLSETDYARFREALQESIVKGIPSFDQNGDFKWRDLLAWMTRDQEARYESLWKWRDTRSNSQTAALNKSSAIRMIGTVLGVFSEETNKLVRRRDHLEAKRKELSDAIGAHSRRRASDVASYDADIKTVLRKFGYIDEASNDLFDLGVAVTNFQEIIQEFIVAESKKRGDLAWELQGFQLERRQINEQIKTIRQHICIVNEAIEKPTNADQPNEFDEVKDSNCFYGGIPFAQCNHFMENLRRRDELVKSLQDGAAAANSEKYRQLIDQQIAEQFDLVGNLENVQANIKRLGSELDIVDTRIRELSFDVDQLGRLSTARSRILGDAPQKAEADELERQLEALSNELSAALLNQSEANVELHAVFDRLVRFVFSNRYTGKINAHKDEPLQFRLVGKRGEAVATLTSVLADLAAMLLSVEGYGYHPRFLIHDSPREADLAASAYGNFLAKVHLLAAELGDEDAPFQYIITTTTKPPEQLKSCIRLELCGYPEDAMLFKKNIDTDLNLALDIATGA